MEKFTKIYEGSSNDTINEFKVEFIKDSWDNPLIKITDIEGKEHYMVNNRGINNKNTALEFFLSDHLAAAIMKNINYDNSEEIKRLVDLINNTNIKWHGRYKETMETCMKTANQIINPI